MKTNTQYLLLNITDPIFGYRLSYVGNISLTAEFCAVFLLPSLLKEAHKFSIDIFDCDKDTVSIYIHCISCILTILLQHGYLTNDIRNKSMNIYYLLPPLVY